MEIKQIHKLKITTDPVLRQNKHKFNITQLKYVHVFII